MNSVRKTAVNPALPAAMILAGVIITLYSHCSPLYIMNTWEDVNGNLTIGKCIVNGIVVYRDIFEQRGPLLYFLHAFAYLISPRSFHGIWIIEILFAAWFVFGAYRILRLYGRQKNIMAMEKARATWDTDRDQTSSQESLPSVKGE